MNLCEHIQNIILQEIDCDHVEVLDPNQDNTHLEAIVVSKEFNQLSLVQQHQRVMKALKVSFSNELHALKLKTYSLKKWQSLHGGVQ